MTLAADDVLRRAFAALQASRVFGVLASAPLSQLLTAGSAVELARGEMLAHRDDVADAAYVVLEGEIEVRAMSKQGREVRIAAHAPPGLIGEMSVLDGAPRSADMVASRRSLVWRLPRAAVLEALRANPDAALALLIELSARLRAANSALELTARRTLEGQLASLLIAQRNRLGYVALPQTEMARLTGYSREKINRKLHAWVEKGWIAVEKTGVLVKEAAPLQALAS